MSSRPATAFAVTTTRFYAFLASSIRAYLGTTEITASIISDGVFGTVNRLYWFRTLGVHNASEAGRQHENGLGMIIEPRHEIPIMMV